MAFNNLVERSNVLVIGCGGAGLRAAIEVRENALSVKILGKRKKNDAHTVLAAGGINAAFGNLDSNDCWEQHFADTFIEGYGISDPKCIEIMARNAMARVLEIDKWGGNLDKLANGKFNQRYFGAHTFRRTCFSGDYTGQSIQNALLNRATSLKIPIFDEEYVTELLISEDTCYGALSFNINSGKRTVHLADSTIICTGGHTRIWEKSSSRAQENLGDGFALALKAGCELIDMEMVQFHPTGMLFPENMVGTLVTEAVRGEGGILLNNAGERFMTNYDNKRMELSTRDRIARANYTEIFEGRGTDRGGVYLDISHKKKEFILSKIPRIYQQFLEYQDLDISKEPMEVAPTAHYSMGGIYVNASNHKTNIEGLYAAGEVAGGLHGANRLGGNSLAEILVFGKISGKSASSYSKSLNTRINPDEIIRIAHCNLDRVFEEEIYNIDNMQNDLRCIMWECCGVVKNHKDLKKGLEKIEQLKLSSKKINGVNKNYDLKKIVNLLDFKSSLLTAESTLKCSLLRNESRGAHFRSDFSESKNKIYNLKIKLEGDNLITSKISHKKMDNRLNIFIKNTCEISNFSKKLIE